MAMLVLIMPLGIAKVFRRRFLRASGGFDDHIRGIKSPPNPEDDADDEDGESDL